MNQTHNVQQKGFTIIELSLAMAFIAMLLLSISLLTIQISALYNKGITMRSVNESGALIMRDIQQTLDSSTPGTIISRQQITGGRLCANGIVYVWNYGGHTTNGSYGFGNDNRFQTGTGDVRFVRLMAPDSYCTPNETGDYPLLPTDSNVFTELLKAGDSTLALHAFTISEDNVQGDDTQRMYRISFTLGTEEGRYINDNSCQADDGSVQGINDDSYCAVNIFTFTARAGGSE